MLCHHRQVDSLTGRVEKLPSPEDWTIMEEALAAILDEAAARAEQEERIAEAAAAMDLSAAPEADQASPDAHTGACVNVPIDTCCFCFTPSPKLWLNLCCSCWFMIFFPHVLWDENLSNCGAQ